MRACRPLPGELSSAELPVIPRCAVILVRSRCCSCSDVGNEARSDSRDQFSRFGPGALSQAEVGKESKARSFAHAGQAPEMTSIAEMVMKMCRMTFFPRVGAHSCGIRAV